MGERPESRRLIRKLMEKVAWGTGTVFENPGIAAALYAGAVVAVIVTTGLRPKD